MKLILNPTMQTNRIKKIITFQSEVNGQYYFRLVGMNGKSLLQSEGYKTTSSRTKTLNLIQESLVTPVPVVEGRALVNKSPVKAVARKVVKGFAPKKKAK